MVESTYICTLILSLLLFNLKKSRLSEHHYLNNKFILRNGISEPND